MQRTLAMAFQTRPVSVVLSILYLSSFSCVTERLDPYSHVVRVRRSGCHAVILLSTASQNRI